MNDWKISREEKQLFFAEKRGWNGRCSLPTVSCYAQHWISTHNIKCKSDNITTHNTTQHNITLPEALLYHTTRHDSQPNRIAPNYPTTVYHFPFPLIALILFRINNLLRSSVYLPPLLYSKLGLSLFPLFSLSSRHFILQSAPHPFSLSHIISLIHSSVFLIILSTSVPIPLSYPPSSSLHL